MVGMLRLYRCHFWTEIITMQLCFFRDAWSEVKGVSKEEARKNYVQKLLEVRVTSPSLSTLTKPLTAIDPEGGRYRRIEEVHHRN